MGKSNAYLDLRLSDLKITLTYGIHLQYYCMIGILYRDPFISARALFAEMTMSEAVEIQKSAARSTQEIVVSLNVSGGCRRLFLVESKC